MRICLAVAESATVIAFLTALAPGIWEPARMLSFSRWVRVVVLVWVVSSFAHANSARESRVLPITIRRFDILVLEVTKECQKAIRARAFSPASVRSGAWL